MKKVNVIVFFILAAAASTFAVSPKVIKTIPENGNQNIDPRLRQIRIEFDQDMTVGDNFSICGGGPNFPETVGKARWLNKRTLVMGVKLKPNYAYEMSINCPSYQNCKSVNGEPAEIYPISFKTTSAANKDPNRPSQSPAVLLQQGIYAEETEGNLEKAMEIYSQIRSDYNDVERISAIATYQLGLCNLKKDNKEKAIDLFQEVVSYFPEQTVAAKKAQQQLDKLGVSKIPELTQEMYNDIDSNGLIHFKMPNKITNKGSEPITTNGFINSDFVNLTKIYDVNNVAIPFETTHEGNIYRYKITFNKPIMPSESMTYYSEGTITKLITPVPSLPNAYQYYMTHSPATGKPTLRIETYLLPKGAKVFSTTPSDMKQTEKDGRIEIHIEKVIPANGSITTAFQYKLADK